jgi:amidase
MSATSKPSKPSETDETAMHYWPLAELARRIEAREVSPVEVTRAMLDRIERLDPRLHAYFTVTADHALAAARRAQDEIAAGRYRGPLHGVPVGIKDLCDTAGVRTTAGMRVMRDRVPASNAVVVQRLFDAGAVMLGKLATTEGAYSEHHPDFDVPVNPWNAALWSGVSSSGSGVGTAAGLCYAALGTDTGGSIRFPSAMNALTGIKPTFGRVPVTGVFPLGPTLDHLGPIARNTLDAALVLDAIAGFDASDPTSALPVAAAYARAARDAASAKSLRGVRVGYDEAWCTHEVDADIAAAIQRAVAVLAELGAEIRPIEMPPTEEAVARWALSCAVEAVIGHEAYFPAREDDYGPAMRMFLRIADGVSAVEMVRTQVVRLRLSGRLRRVFEDVDVIACPSLGVRMEAGLSMLDPAVLVRMPAATRFANPFNFTGSPTVSMPCGKGEDGFPFSLQLVGRHFEEETPIRVASAYQAATDWHRRHPALGD